MDRRRDEAEPVAVTDRRRSIPGHSVTVGTVNERPGWLIARCSCGEQAEARVEVDGVVEAWVTWHRWAVRTGS